jgi:hypothetical protein
MNKQRLMSYVEAAHAGILQSAAELNDLQVVQPGVEGEWSVKDIVAHLTYWQLRKADFLRWARGEPKDHEYLNLDEDTINRMIHGENRDRPWEEVMVLYRRAYQALADEVLNLTDDNLIDTQSYAFTDGKPLWQSIASSTYEHINKHLIPLRRYVRQVRGEPWPQA